MSRIPLALLLLLVAPAALAKPGDTFFCYWVDSPGRMVVTTDIFPGDRKMEKDMSGVFAMDMTKRDGRQARMYDCSWKPSPQEAAEELDAFRAAHASNGFKLGVVDWNPMTR